MPTNRRVFWAVKAVSIVPIATDDPAEFRKFAVHGLQSVGITTSFNLEQVFEVGMISIYDNVEDIPDVEVTLEKVLDGYPLIYHLATVGSPSATLAGRANQRSMVNMAIFPDTNDYASGTPISEVEMSGMYVSSIAYNFPVDGNSTESVTLVGNNKIWNTGNRVRISGFVGEDETQSFLAQGESFGFAQAGGDVPQFGKVHRRQHVDFLTNDVTLDANNQVGGNDATILPPDIPGISSSGTNFPDSNGIHPCHVQNISCSTDFGRESINELGRLGPYYRYINFPTEVTCEIEVLTTAGDNIQALEDPPSGSNLSNRSIKIRTGEGTFINLGTKCKLNTVTYGGADAGGGNATVTYTYTTFNDFTVQATHDPDATTRLS